LKGFRRFERKGKEEKKRRPFSFNFLGTANHTIAKAYWVLNGHLFLQDLINAQTWQMLSGDSQTYLKTLLPPTAFTNYLESLGSDHPSIEKNDMNIDPPPPSNTTITTADQQQQPIDAAGLNLSSSIFTDPHFLAASRTFQDHLYLGWFSAAHLEKVGEFQESVRNGTLAAPWKDEVWNREHRRPVVVVEEPLLSSPERKRRDEEDGGGDGVESKTSSSFTILCESSARTGYVSMPSHTHHTI
jgi:hypothetical protein